MQDAVAAVRSKDYMTALRLPRCLNIDKEPSQEEEVLSDAAVHDGPVISSGGEVLMSAMNWKKRVYDGIRDRETRRGLTSVLSVLSTVPRSKFPRRRKSKAELREEAEVAFNRWRTGAPPVSSTDHNGTR